MNAKQKLQEIIIESFIQDKIGENRFNLMTEKVKNISESAAKQILNEFLFSKDNVYKEEMKRIMPIFNEKMNKCHSLLKEKEKMKQCYANLGRYFISELQKGKSKCSKSKKPETCRIQFEKKIRQQRKYFGI